MENSWPSIEIITPTLNEAKNLKGFLEPILRQDYPKDKLIVTLVDGGSTDETRQIGLQYGCRIIDNEEVLAEPGVCKGITQSQSDLCCVLAVDNILVNQDDFFKKMSKPFTERGVKGAFPIVVFENNEPDINKYINTKAEPFSEFIYGQACNTRGFKNVYPTKYLNTDYVIYDYDAENFPLLALAQGFMLDRKSIRRDGITRHDDILPIIRMIESREEIAYVPLAQIYHYQIMSLRLFIRKFQWRIKNNLEKHRPSGTAKRKNFHVKKYFWLLYAVSIVLPFMCAVYQMIKTKQRFYIYHFICNVVLAVLIPYTFLKYKFGKTAQTYKM